MTTTDAVVVGSGPNGLAAAITLARAGRSVVVLEANDTIGGAARSAELTRPGFIHDLGSSIHPLAVASPFFRSLDLASHGLEWITPPASVAHPLHAGRAAVAWHDLDRTVAGLGTDGAAYRRTYEGYVDRFDELVDFALRWPLRIPPAPLLAARFGLQSLLPAATFARRRWASDEARALFAGHAVHSILPLTRPLTSSFGLLFGASAHAVGWPFPRGGAQALVDALVACLRELGGEVRTGHRVASVADLPDARATILALTPRQVLQIMGDQLPGRTRRRLGRFRYGPAAFKVDYALSGPVPWSNPDVRQAATVHVGGTIDEIARAEAVVAAGRAAERPFVLVAQHSSFDPSRAPDGGHTLWAYCHVPNGFDGDATAAIEQQLERFAPGFRDLVVDRHVSRPQDLQARNANLVGGDIGGGSYSGIQVLARPGLQLNPHTLGVPGLLMASASTYPGAGVHGMPGNAAAELALRTVLA